MGYYMGDYYRGDPGFWSSLKGIASPFLGAIPVVGPALQKAVQYLPGGAKTAVPRLPAAASATAAAASSSTGLISRTAGLIQKHPVLSAAGAAGALGTMAAGGAGLASMMGGGACGVGRQHRRPLKHCGQTLKSGKCGKCFRSMNVCNPRALRRAIRRTRGFAKLAMKTIHIVHPKKKGRFGGFKKRRRA